MYDSSDPEVIISLRFGEIAILEGFITISALEDALEEQISNGPSGEHKPWKKIGEILFNMGYISIEQIEIVLAEMAGNKEKL